MRMWMWSMDCWQSSGNFRVELTQLDHIRCVSIWFNFILFLFFSHLSIMHELKKVVKQQQHLSIMHDCVFVSNCAAVDWFERSAECQLGLWLSTFSEWASITLLCSRRYRTKIKIKIETIFSLSAMEQMWQHKKHPAKHRDTSYEMMAA